MWGLLESFCRFMKDRAPKRSKRRVLISTIASRVYGPNAHKKGWGNRDYFTVEIAKWLYDRDDKVTVDELVQFLYGECVYSIRKKGPILDEQVQRLKGRRRRRNME